MLKGKHFGFSNGCVDVACGGVRRILRQGVSRSISKRLSEEVSHIQLVILRKKGIGTSGTCFREFWIDLEVVFDDEDEEGGLMC